MMRVGILGGSFDPAHMGHLLLGAWSLACGEIDRLMLIPVFEHSLGKRGLPYPHRLEMARALASELGVRAEVSDVESKLPRPSRTLHTLSALAESMPTARFRLVIGQDILAEADHWHRWDDVVSLAPPLLAGRQGAPGPRQAFSLPSVSSTDLRRRLAAQEDCRGLIPASVLGYIEAHGLYRQP